MPEAVEGAFLRRGRLLLLCGGLLLLLQFFGGQEGVISGALRVVQALDG